MWISVRGFLLLTAASVGECAYSYDRIGNSLYFVGKGNVDQQVMNWFDARKCCWEHHGQLVSVQSELKMLQLQQYLVSKGYGNGSTFATSGHSFLSEYPYSWDAVQQKLCYAKWLPGERPRSKSYLSLKLYNTELFMSRSWGNDQYFICEYETNWQHFWLWLHNPYSIFFVCSLAFLISVVCIRIRALIQAKRVYTTQDDCIKFIQGFQRNSYVEIFDSLFDYIANGSQLYKKTLTSMQLAVQFAMTMSMGIFWRLIFLALLMLTSYISFYLEFWQPLCLSPFVKIGQKCYFFSTNKASTYEYYKVAYKGHLLSVPAKLDWLHAGFACETIDAHARLLTVRSAQELQSLSNYMSQHAHSDMHSIFWTGGHCGNFADSELDQKTLQQHYWHYETQPMNFTKFAVSPKSHLPLGFCIYLDFVFDDLFMATASCREKLAYACELEPMD